METHSKTLNPEEIEALLGPTGLGAAKAGGGAPRPGSAQPARGAPRPYDFRKPRVLAPEQAAAVQGLHQTFARNLAGSLSTALHSEVEAHLLLFQQVAYSEFILSLPNPTSFNRLSCEPLSWGMVLEMNPSILYPMMERMLGGNGEPTRPAGRAFTPIEQGLVSSILARVIRQIEEDWKPLGPFRIAITDSETNPQLLQVFHPNELLIRLSWEVVLGRHSGLINLAVPLKAFESIIDRIQRTQEVPTRPPAVDERERILGNLLQAPVEVTAVLEEVPIRLADLLTLQPGDIIETGKPVGAEATLVAGGQACFRGRPGTRRGKRVLRISGDP